MSFVHILWIIVLGIASVTFIYSYRSNIFTIQRVLIIPFNAADATIPKKHTYDLVINQTDTSSGGEREFMVFDKDLSKKKLIDIAHQLLPTQSYKVIQFLSR
jgi:hypothetical protein